MIIGAEACFGKDRCHNFSVQHDGRHMLMRFTLQRIGMCRTLGAASISMGRDDKSNEI